MNKDIGFELVSKLGSMEVWGGIIFALTLFESTQ